ncbi:MAG: hypothetical protein M1814_006168 [Vezdaea aestivalis]|nr:MAG: hypothetical protein M1814_006168 [Vezdaea aestivalis]
MTLNGGIATPFPSAAAPDRTTRTFKHQGFSITTRKLPILKAAPIEAMTASLGIAPPEMIFGDNLVRVAHEASGWAIEFNALDALDMVDKTGKAMLEVRHAAEWQRTREKVHEGIKEVVKPFDWSYTTAYRGTSTGSVEFKDDPTAELPLQALRAPDPILFFDDVMLYEDELADNGATMLSVKIRVMPARMLVLSRFFMRLDDVLFRIRDTRVFIDFGTGVVLREHQARELEYEQVRIKVAGRGDAEALATMRDPNQLVELLPVVERVMETLNVLG